MMVTILILSLLLNACISSDSSEVFMISGIPDQNVSELTRRYSEFTDYLILNCEFVFRPPNKLGLIQFKDYEWPSFGLCPWPENYPLKYRHENLWKESDMAPGTAAYAITPDGAKKMLMAIAKYGIDQSDFMINSFNLKMEYLIPSPVKFNKINLSTSYGTL